MKNFDYSPSREKKIHPKTVENTPMKVFRSSVCKFLVLILSIPFAQVSFAQTPTLDFSTTPDTVVIFSDVEVINSSVNIPAQARYKWIF